MLLKMKTSLSGPHYSFSPRQEIAFDDAFPFSPGEVRRLIDAGYAEYLGSAEDLAAWLNEPAPSMPPVAAAAPAPIATETKKAAPVAAAAKTAKKG